MILEWGFRVQDLRFWAEAAQALQTRGPPDARAEKQIVSLLSIPLETYDVVTVLGLGNYPNVMSLLAPATCKVRCSFSHLAHIEKKSWRELNYPLGAFPSGKRWRGAVVNSATLQAPLTSLH